MRALELARKVRTEMVMCQMSSTYPENWRMDMLELERCLEVDVVGWQQMAERLEWYQAELNRLKTQRFTPEERAALEIAMHAVEGRVAEDTIRAMLAEEPSDGG